MTQQAAQKLDVHLSSFEQVQDELPGHATDWVTALRKDAIDAYKALGWPTTQDEAWKYTSLEPVRKTDFRPARKLDPGTVSAEDIAEHTIDGLDAATLVVVNGHVDPELSDLDALGEGVTVESLATVLEETPERVEDELAAHAAFDESAFCALNTASFRDGAFIHVEENAVVDVPIHVLYAHRAEDQPTIQHPRTLVVAGRSSEVDVIESFLGVGEGQLLTNGVTEIAAGQNATVRHIKLQRETPDTDHLWTFDVTQDRDSVVRAHNLTFGGRITRNEVFGTIDAEGCDAILNGLYFGEDEQHIDNYTQITHAEPHGDSHQLYKGILDDDAHGVFRGTIYVAPDAQKTDGYQHNPNLLLSDGAMANSVPQLEIFADDVLCSHGSTTGEMSDEWLFYLRSRGLDEEAAQNLLVYAFAGEVIEMIDIEPVREVVQDLVLDSLPEGDVVRDAL